MIDHSFHKNSGPKTLQILAEISGAKLEHDDETIEIRDVAPLDQAGKGVISFLDNIKYKEQFQNTKASACIISPKMKAFAPEGCALLLSDTPYKSYALVAQAFYPDAYPEARVSDKAYINPSANIGDGCVIEEGVIIKSGANIGVGTWIEANAVIGENVQIGSQCRIGVGASVSHAVVGEASRLYPGVRIGQDGFGFAIDPTGFVKVPQLGRVIIGDHVEIGANSCIDRGAGPDTIIDDGTWIDNLVQIGHNTQIGKGCVIIAQAGIAGSTTLEDYVIVAAQGGVAGHLTIGQGSRIAAQSGVMKDLLPGSEVMGSPSEPIKQHLRQHATLKKLTQAKKSG